MDAHGEWTPRQQGPAMGTVILVAVVFGLFAGFGGALLAQWTQRSGQLTAVAPEPKVSLPVSTSRQSGQLPPQAVNSSSFANVADAMNEAVVNINTTSVQANPYSIFFGGGGAQQVQGIGTGMLIDKAGHILTNFHVVGDAQKIQVTVMRANGRSQNYPAKFIAGDKQEDLAVIKINAKGLKPVNFGNSDQLRPGDWVMAVGNPFGFEHTVSVGVVSALNRYLPGENSMTMKGLIQTDVSISPGNSGGPLVNMRGQVIGVNSMIYVSRGSQPQGGSISFSIPSNRATRVMHELLTQGKVAHPYIGIKYMRITDEVRQAQRLPMKYGCLVQDVFPQGPAGKAGVQAGDVITEIDGQQMRDQNDLSNFIGKQKVGALLKFTVERWNDAGGDWQQKTVTVKVGDMPPDFLTAMPDSGQPQQQAPEEDPQGSGMPFSPF